MGEVSEGMRESKVQKLTEGAIARLEAGENVVAKASGLYAVKLDKYYATWPAVLMVTDRRLFLYGKAFLKGERTETIRHDRVTGIETEKTLGRWAITIISGGNRLQLVRVSESEMQPLTNALARFTADAPKVALPAGGAPAAMDAAAEIRRLAELQREGLLTEEEFAAKKRQLLGL